MWCLGWYGATSTNMVEGFCGDEVTTKRKIWNTDTRTHLLYTHFVSNWMKQ
jgi:hypothetical protein